MNASTGPPPLRNLAHSVSKLGYFKTLRGYEHFACLSHSAASRISASLMLLFELEYMNRLQCCGWNSVAVMTSVSSSMFTGLMSTMSRAQGQHNEFTKDKCTME